MTVTTRGRGGRSSSYRSECLTSSLIQNREYYVLETKNTALRSFVTLQLHSVRRGAHTVMQILSYTTKVYLHIRWSWSSPPARELRSSLDLHNTEQENHLPLFTWVDWVSPLEVCFRLKSLFRYLFRSVISCPYTQWWKSSKYSTVCDLSLRPKTFKLKGPKLPEVKLSTGGSLLLHGFIFFLHFGTNAVRLQNIFTHFGYFYLI